MMDNKVRIIIIILIVLIIIVSVGGTILYFTTDALKSSETLFQKYVAQNIQNIAEVTDISKEEQMLDLLRSSDFSENTDATLKYLEKESDEEEVYNITEKGISKNSEKSSYRNISATYGDNVLMSVDLLNQNNMYGLRLANLVQQFVSVQNATVSYFVSSMGLDGKYFSETLKGVDISGILQFSNEEVESLTNTYTKLIFADIDKKHYTSKGNSVITLNNKESVTTNAYTLTLTKNELDKIYKRVLNQAINDDIILKKLKQIDNKILEAGFKEPEGTSLQEKYKENLQKIIDGLEYQGEDNRKIVITVYEQNGITVRTSAKTENSEYTIDLDPKNGKTLSLKTSVIKDNSEITKIYTLGKTSNEQGYNRTFTYNDSVQNLTVSLDNLNQENGMEIEVNANYTSDKITNLDIGSKTNIELSANEAIPVYFDDNNNIVLNNYEGNQIKSILDNLKKRVITSLENSQSIINTKLLGNIILKIDENQQKIAQEQKSEEELKKENFNNKFALYEGEDLELEYVKKLLKTVGQNMSDYKVITGTQMRIYIKEGEKNEEMANKIWSVIEESSETFNVKINYNEEGYVESIDLTVYQKN